MPIHNKYGGSHPGDSLSWDINLFVCDITTLVLALNERLETTRWWCQIFWTRHHKPILTSPKILGSHPLQQNFWTGYSLNRCVWPAQGFWTALPPFPVPNAFTQINTTVVIALLQNGHLNLLHWNIQKCSSLFSRDFEHYLESKYNTIRLNHTFKPETWPVQCAPEIWTLRFFRSPENLVHRTRARNSPRWKEVIFQFFISVVLWSNLNITVEIDTPRGQVFQNQRTLKTKQTADGKQRANSKTQRNIPIVDLHCVPCLCLAVLQPNENTQEWRCGAAWAQQGWQEINVADVTSHNVLPHQQK